MRQYIDTLQDNAGNALFGAIVTVKDFTSGALSSIYADNGISPIASSQVTTDATGQFSFFAADSDYTLQFTLNSQLYKTQSPVTIFDAAWGVTFTDTGIVNAYAVTDVRLEKALRAGLRINVKIGISSTGAATFNYNALGAKAISDASGGALASGALQAGAIVLLEYTGTVWQARGGAFALAALAPYLTVDPGTGKVTIANQTAGPALTVNGSTFGTPSILVTGGAASAIGYGMLQAGQNPVLIYNPQSSNDLRFQTNNLDRLTVLGTGGVVVSTPTSGPTLTLNTLGTNPGVFLQSTAGNASILSIAGNGGAANTGLALYQDNTQAAYVNQQFNGPLFLNTNNATRVTVSSTGNVSVATPTSVATASLTVNVTTANVVQRWTDGTNPVSLYISTSISTFGNEGTNPFGLATNGVTRLTIAANGGITETAPASGVAPFTINSGGSAYVLTVNSPAGNYCAVTYNIGGAGKGVYGVAGIANDLITGSSANETCIVATANLNFSSTSGASRQMLINTSGQVQVNPGVSAVAGSVFSSGVTAGNEAVAAVGASSGTGAIAFYATDTGMTVNYLLGWGTVNWTTTAGNTLTPTWTNYPGTTGTKNPVTWIRVSNQGGVGYVPVFN